MRSSRIGVVPKFSIPGIRRQRDTVTHRDDSCVKKEAEIGDVAARQGIPRMLATTRGQEGARGFASPESSEERCP